MKKRSKWRQIVSCLLAMFVVMFVVVTIFVGWATYRVANFLAEFPDRIVFDVDDQFFSQLMIESMNVMVREGPKPQRITVINYLSDAGSEMGPAATLYLDELMRAATDPDPEIAAAAQAAVDILCRETAVVTQNDDAG